MIKLYEHRIPGTEVEEIGLLGKKATSTEILLFKLFVWYL